MKKFVPSLLTIAVLTAIQSSAAYAENKNSGLFDRYFTTDLQCMVNVPRFERPLVNGDINTLPVNVEADALETFIPNSAVYQGNVTISQGNRDIDADSVAIETRDDDSRFVTLTGDITYLDNQIQMKGQKATLELATNEVKITQAKYHLTGRLGRGQADAMELQDHNRYIVLNNGTFTSCPVNDNSWSIKGSTVIHDNDEELLQVWNAVFNVGSVPVFYTPYIQLPTGNTRRSGLLMPTYDYDSIDGLAVSVPFYWNISPNMDMTLTPRFILRRGVQLQTETRYLSVLGSSLLSFDWMQHDSLYNDDDNVYDETNRHRWLFHFDHYGLIDQKWRININTSRVSDKEYLNDYDSSYAKKTDGYLNQYYSVGYNDEHWDLRLSTRHFQALSSGLKDNMYQTEPQFDLNYYDALGPFAFKTYAQSAYFTSEGKDNPETWRTHIEPSVNYLLANSWGSLTTEGALLATHYNQSIPNSNRNADLESGYNRVLPKFSVDGKVVFTRDVDFMDGYTQTLEPRIKYLYIPYRDQSTVANYDSSLMQSDYFGLFRDVPYSGLDRIASANKLTSGVTSRFYDDDMVERFNISLGQVYYFTQSKTGDKRSSLDQNSDTGSLTWATDSLWRVNDDVIVRGGMQYDTRIDTVAIADLAFEYRPTIQKMFQVSYRYADKNYIDALGVARYKPYEQDISQVGVMTSWPLTSTVTAVASYYYDTKLEKTADSFLGVEYSDCCWAIGVQYGRKIKEWDSTYQISKYENRLSVTFELRGFGRESNRIAKMLNFGLLPYQTRFD